MACEPAEFESAAAGLAPLEHELPLEQIIHVANSVDGSVQPSLLLLPEGTRTDDEPRPMVVSMHRWSANFLRPHEELEQRVLDEGWIYLAPDYRGPNTTSEACGSTLAQQDILDAVDWVASRVPVDEERIYLSGVSAGGHMAMLMAGRHPERWTAVSAWSGISDLEAWYDTHEAHVYAHNLRTCTGGAPGDGPEVDAEYAARSPKTFLSNATMVPVDLAAGRHDGHGGYTVPIHQSLDAFNVIAAAVGAEAVSTEEIEQLARPNGQLEEPKAGDRVIDLIFGREIFLRRRAGAARVTIFEGGHEDLPAATLDWFRRHPG